MKKNIKTKMSKTEVYDDFSLTHSSILSIMRKVEIKTSRLVNNYFSGDYQSMFRGKGIEFDEVRSYVVGDDPRSMDWKVSARYGTPYIKRFKEERELNVMFLLDFSSSNNFGTTKSKKRLIVEITALLAFSAINNNDKVGLIIFTDEVEKFVAPKKGRSHIFKIISEIIDYKPKSENTDIKASINFLNKVMKSRSMVFLFTDFCSNLPKKEIEIAKKKHDLILCFVEDNLESNLPNINALLSFEDSESSDSVFIDLSDKTTINSFSKEQETLKSEKLKSIKLYGVNHIIFNTNNDYIYEIIKFFKARK